MIYDSDVGASSLEIGRIPISHHLPSGGNKNWPPSMKVKKLEFYGNKSGLKGCKWPSLNAPGTGITLFHPILKLGEFPFPIISPLG